jgi:AcrR family transcriptional regulator
MASKIREKILSHALRCFASRGYAGSSTMQISQSANVSEHSLFRLFGSKERLFDEALSLALSRSKMRPVHLRVIAFAVLEGRASAPKHQSAIRKLAKTFPLLRELNGISR